MGDKMRNAAHIGSVTRLTNLAIALLRSEKGLTNAQIAHSVEGYSPDEPRDTFDKRFRRDRQKLEAVGLPVTFDESFPRRYRIERSDVIRGDISLSFKDRCALSVAAQAALSDDGFFLKENLGNAARKLGLDLPQDPEASPSTSAEIASVIANARLHCKTVEFKYSSVDSDSARTRTALPISLFTYQGDWYLSALDTEIDELRTFKLKRIEGIAIGDPSCVEIEAQNPILFPFQIGDECFDAKIFLSEGLEERIDAITWGKGELAECTNGYLWTVEARDSIALASWVIENGPGMLLLEPKELAISIEKHLLSILESLEVLDD